MAKRVAAVASKTNGNATVNVAGVQVDPTPDPTTALAAVRANTSPVLARAQALQVRDNATCTDANAMLLALAGAKKQVEEQRAVLVKPLKDHVKKLESMFKAVMEPLEAADATLRSRVLTWRRAEFERAEAERATAEAAAIAAAAEAEELRAKAERARGKKAHALAAEATAAQEVANDAAVAAASVTAPTRRMEVGTEGAGVATRTRWTFEVVNAAQVPAAYLQPNEKMISAAVRSGIRDIAGVRIYSEETLAVGGM
jgi:hypothetical protein